MREIAALLAYEATADLATTSRELETPLEKMIGAELKEKIGLVPILRAGPRIYTRCWGVNRFWRCVGNSARLEL